MSPFAAARGLPLSSDSSSASSAPFALISSASAYMRLERLAAWTLRSGPSSAARAAEAARAASSGPPSATSQMTSPVAGSIVSKVRPSAASGCSPPIRSRFGPESTNSRAVGERASAVAVAITGIVVGGLRQGFRAVGRLGYLALRLKPGDVRVAAGDRGPGRARRPNRPGGPGRSGRSRDAGRSRSSLVPAVGLAALVPGTRLVRRDERRLRVLRGRRPPGLNLDTVVRIRDPEARAAVAHGAVVRHGAVGGTDARGVAGRARDVVGAGVDLADDLVLERAAAVQRRLRGERSRTR